MPKGLTIAIGILFVLVLVLSSVTYTVRFTEAAVLTTFGKAGDGANQTSPGLKWKLPYPIQSVTKYDTRLQWVQTRAQGLQTSDARQIIVESFATWRVSDPLKFFQRFGNAGPSASDHFKKAEETIRSSLAASMSSVSDFRMDEIFTPEVGKSRLRDLEAKMQQVLGAGAPGSTMPEFGVTVVGVGISRVILPDSTTKPVIERMQANRDRLVKEIETKGEAEATSIKSAAETMADKIEAFASQRAAEIRGRGDREAAQFLAKMNTNAELAVFLKNIELINALQSKRTTIISSTGLPGMGLLDPAALENLKPGQIPSANLPPVGDEAKSVTSTRENTTGGGSK